MRVERASRPPRTPPLGWADPIRELSLFALAYLGYEVVRGLVGRGGPRPFDDATRIIDLERGLHVFTEARIQSWVTLHAHWLLDAADWTYLNTHLALTTGALVFIYLRRNDSFRLVRTMFLFAMLIALVGYTVFPAAPPRLMPAWGFSDSIRRFTGVDADRGAAGLLLNPYAAIPSMHVCVALMVGGTMSRLVVHPVARLLWRLYPLWIVFVVIVTGNHLFTDVALGALTATVSAVLARKLSWTRPRAWAFPLPTRSSA